MKGRRDRKGRGRSCIFTGSDPDSGHLPPRMWSRGLTMRACSPTCPQAWPSLFLLPMMPLGTEALGPRTGPPLPHIPGLLLKEKLSQAASSAHLLRSQRPGFVPHPPRVLLARSPPPLSRARSPGKVDSARGGLLPGARPLLILLFYSVEVKFTQR